MVARTFQDFCRTFCVCSVTCCRFGDPTSPRRCCPRVSAASGAADRSHPATDESEVETFYTLRAVCRAAAEAHIRADVVQALAKTNSISERCAARISRGYGPGGGRSRTRALSRDDVALATAVSRLSVEPSVISVEWHVTQVSASFWRLKLPAPTMRSAQGARRVRGSSPTWTAR
jgi:hypothetical protein